MPFVFFEPSFHLVHLLLRYHTLVVEYARILLQVFKRGALARSLALRRDIIEYIFDSRHIEERPLVRVFRNLVRARSFRALIRRVLYVEYNGLIV